jgi:ribosomal protein S6--L-glutamate ligase
MGQDIVLQEYVRESKGRDVRVIVVGGRVVASMRRVAKAGEFRSNLHRGGRGDKVVLPRAYRSVAIRAAKAMGLEVAGVDMLEGKAGPKILEINSSPGLEGVERASGVDVAGAIITHAERYAVAHGRLSKRDLDQRLANVIHDERAPLSTRARARSGVPS